jgi:signal transduction histidine kinase
MRAGSPADPRSGTGGHATGPIDARSAAPLDLDPRVSMVLAVLRGRQVDDVAKEWDIDPSLLDRWVRDFLVAGSGVITNRPDPDVARQRDRFMTAFAHELRTPLAAARGWAMLLSLDEVPSDQLSHAHGRVLDALTRLTEHVLDVELAAAVSLGRTRVNIELVDVASLARGLAGSPSVRHGSHLKVRADPKLLGRVLRDLWTTANRDPVPAAVHIDVVETGSWHEIRVVREGVQISPMVLKALFDPFDANDDTTGVTLGLYPARALTVAHGGFLGAEGEGQRTVLLVRLPRDKTD